MTLILPFCSAQSRKKRAPNEASGPASKARAAPAASVGASAGATGASAGQAAALEVRAAREVMAVRREAPAAESAPAPRRAARLKPVDASAPKLLVSLDSFCFASNALAAHSLSKSLSKTD